jgi:hypothetical protein
LQICYKEPYGSFLFDDLYISLDILIAKWEG